MEYNTTIDNQSKNRSLLEHSKITVGNLNYVMFLVTYKCNRIKTNTLSSVIYRSNVVYGDIITNY